MTLAPLTDDGKVQTNYLGDVIFYDWDSRERILLGSDPVALFFSGVLIS